MSEVETPVAVQETDGAVKSKETTTTATQGPQSPSKLKAAMKEKDSAEKIDTTEKKAEESESAGDAKETVDAVNLLAQGKRNMLCGEVPQAVQQLQEACRLLAAKYGDTGDECGDAYLSYGTALLDLSRMESGVLGNALDGIDSEDDDKAASADEDEEKMTEEEKEKISDEIIDAMCEDREPKDKKEGKSDGDKKEDSKEDKTDAAKTKENADKPVVNGHAKNGKANGLTNGHVSDKDDEPMETDGKKPDTSDDKSEATEAESEDIADEEGGTEEEGEDNTEEEGTEGETSADDGEAGTSKEAKEEEDVSNLQLAWEVLELAKVIYTRNEGKEMQLKAADAHLKLGEVGLETEQYETAIEDLNKCLALQQKHLEPENRRIAETHYQIGLAACFAQKYEDSLKNLRKAVEVINSKIKKLEALIEEDEKSEKKENVSAFDDPIPGAKKEVQDLKEILPDILAKIEDTEDEKKSQEKVKKMVKENLKGTEESSTSSAFDASSSDKSEAKPASDISHLVRKKRKPEDDAEVSEEATKKSKQEEAKVNGAGDAKKTEASS